MIRKRGKNRWEVRVELDRDPTTGRRRQSYITVRGTRRDAEKAQTEALHRRDTGVDVAPSRLRVGDYLERWLDDYAAGNVQPSTLQRYGEIVSRARAAIGSHRLRSLRTAHVQSFYSELRAAGLAPRTIVQYHRVLREALKHAVDWGYLSVNPAASAKPPKFVRHEMSVLTAAEVGRVLNACPSEDMRALVAFSVTTGARQGEVLALRWQDVDLAGGEANVLRTLHYENRESYEFRGVKTARSRRSIRLAGETLRRLNAHRGRQAARRLELGPVWVDEDLVFCRDNGAPLDPTSVTRAFKRVAAAVGHPDLRFHDLRHTAATLMLRADVNAKVVSERLGHTTVGFTLDTYAHVLPDMQAEAAMVLDDVIARASGR